MKLSEIVNPKTKYNMFDLSLIDNFNTKHNIKAEYFNNILHLTSRNTCAFPLMELVKLFNKLKINYAFSNKINNTWIIIIYED